MSREEETADERALLQLDKWNAALAGKTFATPGQQFDFLRGEFAVLTDRREEVLQEAEEKLSNAFAFLEKHFAPAGVPGPEMILFVTELAAGYYSLWFIETQGSESFDRYNAMLRVDSGREKLQDRIRAASLL